jgi:phosphorylcholine metabolism protein LicD
MDKITTLFGILLLLLFIVVIWLLLSIYNKKKEDKIMCEPCKNLLPNNFKKLITSNDPRIIKIKQKVYTDILKKTISAMKRLNIPVFLSSGTCLGYFREGKFIDYDYDIDVGIWSKDYTPLIVDELKKENINLYRVMGTVKDGMELSFRMPGTILGKYAKIDIFLHYKETINGKKKISWYTYAAPKYIKKVQYRVNDFDLKEVDFMGNRVSVPENTIQYILDHYGEDWMVPKKPFTEYTYHSSPRSIVK